MDVNRLIFIINQRKSIAYTYAYVKYIAITKVKTRLAAGFNINWQRPTLPVPRGTSTIGAEGLNLCVRNGNRCFPFAKVTRSKKTRLYRLLGPDGFLVMGSVYEYRKKKQDTSRFESSSIYKKTMSLN